MPSIVLRPGRLNRPGQTGADDAETLLSLVRGLALYENEPDAVKATAEDLRRHGSGPNPRFETLIVELDGRPAGFALYYHNFSTWTGRPGLFLEDLFVEEWARGHGLGRRLMARCARIAKERGCVRFDLSVLHWNKTREFYHRLGLRHLEEWLPYRAAAEGLERLAAEDEA
ncbi:MAG: GNAT family N-acetyltransferase [Alphaproteobacteria bacterium]|nr:GNAT family N-acetyltransferase [Alphaproteobacteria bacterium]